MSFFLFEVIAMNFKPKAQVNKVLLEFFTTVAVKSDRNSRQKFRWTSCSMYDVKPTTSVRASVA